jgi:hypothetical protein
MSDGAPGTGPRIAVSALSRGAHTLTLTITDAHNRPGRASIQGLVLPPDRRLLAHMAQIRAVCRVLRCGFCALLRYNAPAPANAGRL